MTSPSLPRRRRRLPKSQRLPWQAIVDSLVMLLWGLMFLRFAVTGQLYLLLHPDFMWLAHLAMVILLVLGLARLVQVWNMVRQTQPQETIRSQEHFALLPRRLSCGLLLAVAMFGMVYTPRPFMSETAFQRGITDVLGQTRSRPERFVLSGSPEDRSIVDWIRTLNVYPEPDAYTGQGVKVSGFVTHMPDWPSNMFMITRFVLTCCAADAYPVGLPVELPEGTSRPEPDTWLEVEGTMQTDTLDDTRQLVIGSPTLTEISQPRNPFEY
ncbi:TIGR03943 family protein [Nodosilinea sp. P-1105]|uniref:TIGR03943 family putative permease subunit n=1 Tax=Nodosilinea sp. P-1105 TaxID=2546229 RepID=UPI0019825EC6|nr:TIGR03943 family protein [Nodosilinea sp. P-1105]